MAQQNWFVPLVPMADLTKRLLWRVTKVHKCCSTKRSKLYYKNSTIQGTEKRKVMWRVALRTF